MQEENSPRLPLPEEFADARALDSDDSRSAKLLKGIPDLGADRNGDALSRSYDAILQSEIINHGLDFEQIRTHQLASPCWALVVTTVKIDGKFVLPWKNKEVTEFL